MLQLRRVAADDRQRLFDWRNSDGVRRFMVNDSAIPWSDHVAWFNAVLARDDTVLWVIEIDGQPSGMVGLTSIDRLNSNAELGIYLAPHVQRGRGAGAAAQALALDAAFGELGLHRVYLRVLEFNTSMRKVQEKLGLAEEGILRSHVRREDGSYVDLVLYAVLSEEWTEGSSRRTSL